MKGDMTMDERLKGCIGYVVEFLPYVVDAMERLSHGVEAFNGDEEAMEQARFLAKDTLVLAREVITELLEDDECLTSPEAKNIELN
jgi:AMMECR1 domain-containing protein